MISPLWFAIGYVVVAFLVGGMLHHLDAFSGSDDQWFGQVAFAAFWAVCLAAMAFGYSVVLAWRLTVLATRAPANLVMAYQERRESRRIANEEVERLINRRLVP